MVESINNNAAAAAAVNIPPHISAGRKADGHFAQMNVSKRPTPSQNMQDLQEELSFAHSEKTQEKNIEEHECKDFHDNLYVEIIAKIQKEYPPQEQPQKDNAEKFIQHLRQNPPQDENELRQMLGQITEDQAEGFAILQQVINDPPDDLADGQVRLMRSAASAWAAENASALLAGANTIDLAQTQSQKISVEASQLQKTYQNLVTSYEGILPALTKITSEQGVDKLENMTGFLMQAADKDLTATRSSVQPERLRRILAEFQGVKMFNTLREWSNQVFARFSQKFQTQTSIKKNDLFTRCLKFISAPESFNSQILTPIRALAPSDKVLVLQELRNGVRNLPDYLFANAKTTKSRILFPVQNEIDQLVFEQDA